jgi:hypothetical protein
VYLHLAQKQEEEGGFTGAGKRQGSCQIQGFGRREEIHRSADLNQAWQRSPNTQTAAGVS